MDKKLLDALNNLSDSLQEIADALRDNGGGGNKAPTTEALQMGNFGGDMMAIVASIKSVKQDTQEILKQQKTILNMSRKQDQKTDMFEKAGDKKSESNVKKGVGTILLIAVAVLAIGAAFKLVGNVDFVSVIALSMAMFVLAEAFARIGVVVAKMSLRDVLRTGLALVAISVAVAISSHILKKTASIGFPQILSAGLIIGMFAAVSRSIQPLILPTSEAAEVAVGNGRHIGWYCRFFEDTYRYRTGECDADVQCYTDSWNVRSRFYKFRQARAGSRQYLVHQVDAWNVVEGHVGHSGRYHVLVLVA